MICDSVHALAWSMEELSNAYRKKNISPVEITKMLIEHITKTDKKINAYISINEEMVLEEAKRAEQSFVNGNDLGPLHGIPIAVKDCIDVKGYPNTSGSELYKDYYPEEDAILVQKLKKAGAIIIGKTNMHELGYGTTGDISYYGPIRNPIDPKKMSGGSSSGSAAALASYMAFGAIGSDTGGSIRVPSSFCGTVGMKPTFGSVSRRGTLLLDVSLNHLGPMTRTVKDNAMLLDAVIGYDPEDPYSVKRKQERFSEGWDEIIPEFTIGVPLKYDFIQDEVEEAMGHTKKELLANGLKFKNIDLDLFETLLDAYKTIVFAEGYEALEEDLIKHGDKIGAFTRKRALEGKHVPASEYVRAMKIKHDATRYLLDLFQTVDVIMLPTVPILPPDLNQREIYRNGREIPVLQILGKHVSPINVVGFPAISVPSLVKNGFPVGVQIIGKPYSEKKLYKVASMIEKIYS